MDYLIVGVASVFIGIATGFLTYWIIGFLRNKD